MIRCVMTLVALLVMAETTALGQTLAVEERLGPVGSMMARGDDDQAGDCAPVEAPTVVLVKTRVRGTYQGTLTCLGQREVTILTGTTISAFDLAEVRKIHTPADGVLDGALKGVAVAAIIGIACAGACPASVLVRTALAYGAMGLVFDALSPNTRAVYGSRPLAVTFSKRW